MLFDPSGTLVAVDEYCNIERTNQKAALISGVVGMLCSRTMVKHTFISMMSTYRKRWKINLYTYLFIYLFIQYRVQRGLKAVEFCLIFIEIS